MTRRYYSEISFDANMVEMLDGFAYRWFDHIDLPTSGVKEYLVYAPEGVDVIFYGRGFSGRGANIKLQDYINPTFSSQGTDFKSRAFNRNEEFRAIPPQVGIWQDPVITDEGILTDYDETAGSVSESSGVKGSAGSQTSQEFPRIIPKDSYFLIRVTNLSASNPASFVLKLFWSEVPVGQ